MIKPVKSYIIQAAWKCAAPSLSTLACTMDKIAKIDKWESIIIIINYWWTDYILGIKAWFTRKKEISVTTDQLCLILQPIPLAFSLVRDIYTYSSNKGKCKADK